MSKKVLVISTSLRAGSNSDLQAVTFMNGAREAGHEVEKVSLKGKSIGFCRGCLACQKTGNCVIQDDAGEIGSTGQTGKPEKSGIDFKLRKRPGIWRGNL